MTNIETAISVQNVSKKFVIPHEKISTLKGAFVNIFRKKSFETFYALDDVSFEVKKGEFFGIVGRNGSGKSTLLKILAGVYTADKGQVSIHGMVSPFLELGIGFNPELSGRDNIYLNATILGLTEKEIDKKFDSIVAFSELERFIDQKVKNYSSGMQVRLAFSVSIHANRDILLMDEVLAVGDTNFQSKCLREFIRYKEMGKTVILVTHDIRTIQKYCDRSMLLREGKIAKIGNAYEVVNEYIYQNMSDEEKRMIREQEQEKVLIEKEVAQAGKEAEKLKGKEFEEEQKRIADEKRKHEEERKKQEEERKNKAVEITSVEFLDKHGKVRNVFETGEDISIRTYIKINQINLKLNLGLTIHGEANEYIFGINTYIDKIDVEKHIKDGYFQIDFPKIPLKANTYYFIAGVFGETEAVNYDLTEKMFFKIFSKGGSHGLVKMEYKWK